MKVIHWTIAGIICLGIWAFLFWAGFHIHRALTTPRPLPCPYYDENGALWGCDGTRQRRSP